MLGGGAVSPSRGCSAFTGTPAREYGCSCACMGLGVLLYVCADSGIKLSGSLHLVVRQIYGRSSDIREVRAWQTFLHVSDLFYLLCTMDAPIDVWVGLVASVVGGCICVSVGAMAPLAPCLYKLCKHEAC